MKVGGNSIVGAIKPETGFIGRLAETIDLR